MKGLEKSMASMRVQLQNTKHYWGRILGWNPDKSFKSIPPCYSQSSLYCFALRFLFRQIHATSVSFYSSVTVHCKGDRRKTWQKTIPPSLWFKKSKPQVRELSRVCPETSAKLGFCTNIRIHRQSAYLFPADMVIHSKVAQYLWLFKIWLTLWLK